MVSEGWRRGVKRVQASRGKELLESETSRGRIHTHNVPRIEATVAPEFVTKTPHRSVAETIKTEPMATIIFPTPLERNKHQNVAKYQHRRGHSR